MIQRADFPAYRRHHREIVGAYIDAITFHYLKGEIPPMLQPWQKRVVTEHEELVEKRQKLAQFSNTPEFAALDDTDKGLLHKQYHAMVDYASALRQRIERFQGGGESPLPPDLAKPKDNVVQLASVGSNAGVSAHRPVQSGES